MPEIQIAGVILTMLGVAAWWLTTKENKEKKQNEENKRGCCSNCYHEQHKDCYCLECQCKNDVCAELRKKYWQKRRAWLAALVAGQDVSMFSGCYRTGSKVVKVTPEGVDVDAYELLHFDKDGRSYLTELPGPQDWKPNGTYECGPWYLDDMPFTERTALLEQGASRVE